MMRHIVSVLTLAGTLCLTTSAFTEEKAPEWSHSGKDGPAHWGDLAKDYATCKIGQRQSPIDLKPKTATRLNQKNLIISYKTTVVTVVNNGHTIQATPQATPSTGWEGAVSFKGENFKLAQFHFHHPSEHTLNGRSFPLEVHFVNTNAAGNLTVIGVFIKEGAENKALASLFSTLPSEGATAVPAKIDIGMLLPQDRKALAYSGSLTTPPCSEPVNWIVMQSPIEMSAAQIAAFAKLFPNNHRPVQELHGRTLNEIEAE